MSWRAGVAVPTPVALRSRHLPYDPPEFLPHRNTRPGPLSAAFSSLRRAAFHLLVSQTRHIATMGGVDQPFLYSTEAHIDARFPQPRFDPKAVTRASWENKPLPPRQDGPLLPFNRHPEYVCRWPTGPRRSQWIGGSSS